ncbi:MAG: hypothetical protein AAGC66_03845 [Leifsonia sp.]
MNPVRITSATTKVAYVVAAYAITITLAFGLAAAFGAAAGVLVVGVLQLVLIGIAVRVFRGRDEAVVPPRPWWKMTARPFAGFVMAALFAAQAVCAVFAPSVGSWAAALAGALIAVGYLNSSVRLTLSEKRTSQLDG